MSELTATRSTPGSAPDPRRVITSDAFRVAPELLGLPLANPWRRGVAMLLDLVFIAVLSGVSSVLFGFAAAAVLFRMSGKPAPGGYLKRSVRLLLRFWAAGIVFVVILTAWGSISDWAAGGDDDDRPAVEMDGDLRVSGLESVGAVRQLALLGSASTREEALPIAAALVAELRASGVDDEDIREMIVGLSELPGRGWMVEIADSLVGRAPEDTLGAPGDTVARLIAAVQSAEERAAELDARVDELQDELDEGPGIMAVIRRLGDDLGIGFGWAGLYFTTFVTLWKGRTPGKRLMGLRVIRLDGQQLGWWAAFERFGGYAAGLATGLLGFAQIFWDRNRQAVQDKLSETVVVRESRG